MSNSSAELSRVRFEGLDCLLTIERPALAVVLICLSGHDVGEFGGRPFEELGKDLEAHGRLELFIDARRAKGASTDVSGGWAVWLQAHKDRFAMVSMLTGSRFIQMSAGFVRKFAGLGEAMRIYTDPEAFDTALRDAVASADR